MKKNRLFAILIAFFTFSCFAQNWKADHVFLIGLDGWGAIVWKRLRCQMLKL